MASVVVDDRHLLGVHIEVLRNTEIADPQQAFSAALDVPGQANRLTLPIRNDESVQFPLHIGAIDGEIVAVVEDFALLPPGTGAKGANTASFKLVFKLKEFIGVITIGSIDVRASLKPPLAGVPQSA
jgi:hypothetical protein